MAKSTTLTSIRESQTSWIKTQRKRVPARAEMSWLSRARQHRSEEISKRINPIQHNATQFNPMESFWTRPDKSRSNQQFSHQNSENAIIILSTPNRSRFVAKKTNQCACICQRIQSYPNPSIRQFNPTTLNQIQTNPFQSNPLPNTPDHFVSIEPHWFEKNETSCH